MKIVGYIALSVAALAWLVLMVIGLIKCFPVGIIGILVLVGLAFLLGYVIKTRVQNKEDQYYIKNVEK